MPWISENLGRQPVSDQLHQGLLLEPDLEPQTEPQGGQERVRPFGDNCTLGLSILQGDKGSEQSLCSRRYDFL